MAHVSRPAGQHGQIADSNQPSNPWLERHGPESEIDGFTLCQTSGQPLACMYMDASARTRQDCPASETAGLRARRDGRARCRAWWTGSWAGVCRQAGQKGAAKVREQNLKGLRAGRQARRESSFLSPEQARGSCINTLSLDNGGRRRSSAGGRKEDKTVT